MKKRIKRPTTDTRRRCGHCGGSRARKKRVYKQPEVVK